MTKTLILAAFALAGTNALAQPATPAEPAPELKALADSCSAHKFETMVLVDQSRGKTVKICGKPGQTDAEWLVTLKDSATKVAADANMSQAVKDQILAALKLEIERLEVETVTLVASPAMTIAHSPEPVVVPEAAPQYSSVPPLPAPKPRALTVPATAAAAKPLIRPQLTIRCAMPREAFAACTRLERETQLIIRADADMPAGAGLRFVRGGDSRAELDLGTLKKGDSLREKLPGRVCSGVLRGRVEVQVLTKGQVAETLGPFALYCGA